MAAKHPKPPADRRLTIPSLEDLRKLLVQRQQLDELLSELQVTPQWCLGYFGIFCDYEGLPTTNNDYCWGLSTIAGGVTCFFGKSPCGHHEMFILSNMMAHSSMWFFSGANKNLRRKNHINSDCRSTLYVCAYIIIYIYMIYCIYIYYIYMHTYIHSTHTHTVYSTYGTSIYMLISRLYRVCIQLRKQGCPRFLQCLRHIQLRVDYDLVHGVDSLHKAVTCTDSGEGLSPDCCNCQRWQYVDWHAPSPSQIDSIR